MKHYATRSIAREVLYLLCASMVLAASIVSAQSPQGNGGGNNGSGGGSGNGNGASAADAWANVLALSRPAPISRYQNGRSKTHVDIDNEIARHARSLREAAQAAHGFYILFPADPNAEEARKLETLCTIKSVDTANHSNVQAALALGQSFRADLAHSVADRCDVALAMDRLDLSFRAREGQANGSVQDQRQIADSLRSEFGEVSAVQAYYLQIARSADRTTAVELARQVSRGSSATPEMKAQAREIIERSNLVGKKLHLSVTQLDGHEIDLSQGNGKIRVIFAWRGSESDALKEILRYQKRLQGLDVVCLALSGSPEEVTVAKRGMGIKAAYCHAPAGPMCRAAVEELKLHYAPVPWVFVLDSNGVVVGSGAVKELAGLLHQAGV